VASELPTDFAISSGDESDKEDQLPTRSLFSRKWVNAEMYQQFSGDAHDLATFEDLSDLQVRALTSHQSCSVVLS
jgi:hypothetical protein